MSQYEAYDRTAGHYDATRSALGVEIWLGHLASHFPDLSRVRVLDAGCGTGNFALALAERVGHVTGIDVNQQMLNEARRKAQAKGLTDRVSFDRGELPQLPFEDGSLDAVMFNQVLHHLEPLGSADFSNHQAAVREASRVLSTDGLILINACSRVQMTSAYWYHALIPAASRRGLDRTIATRDLESALASSNFENISRTVPLNALLQGSATLRSDGPLDAGWRAGDSIWALTTDEELTAAVARARELQDGGKLEEFMRTHDKPRDSIGQTTFWCAVKKAL